MKQTASMKMKTLTFNYHCFVFELVVGLHQDLFIKIIALVFEAEIFGCY